MENLSILTQQLILAQNAAKIHYFVGSQPLTSELNVFDLALRQRLLADLASLSNLATIRQTPFMGNNGLLLTQQKFQLPQEHAVCKTDSSPVIVPSLGLSMTCSEISSDSALKLPRLEEQEENQKGATSVKKVCNSFNSASKKIQKIKSEEEVICIESPETGKHSPESDEGKKNKKNRRPADQFQRMFKCPSQYCEKSYGSETSLKVHIKNKHTLTISQERLIEIEALLSKISKKN